MVYYWDTPKVKHSWLAILADATEQPYKWDSKGKIIEASGPTLASLYMSALYYTLSSLTTCGFGHIAPNTTAEKLFGCVTMLMGCKSYFKTTHLYLSIFYPFKLLF